MKEAKLFQNGQSQAVRLPKEFRFDENTAVYINKVGDSVVLTPKDNPWQSLVDACAMFSDDFMDEREQGSQERDFF